MTPLLQVEDASVTYVCKKEKTDAVQRVSFSIFPGEIIGVVGESGSGKSSLFQSLFRLMPEKAEFFQKRCFFDQEEISSLSDQDFRKKVYKKIGWVPQDPFLSLNPRKKIKKQLVEALLYHAILPKKEALEKIHFLLKEMEVPLEKMELYPHELSGGLRQRVLLAMALSTNPLLLIADEPSSSLDVLLQKQLLSLFHKIHREFSTTLILISHDVGFLSKICSRFFVMYGGKIVEKQKTSSILKEPLHPYTKALFNASLSFEKPLFPSIEKSFFQRKHPLKGCPFIQKCPFAMQICKEAPPPFFAKGEAKVACFKYHPDSPHEALSSSTQSYSHISS